MIAEAFTDGPGGLIGMLAIGFALFTLVQASWQAVLGHGEPGHGEPGRAGPGSVGPGERAALGISWRRSLVAIAVIVGVSAVRFSMAL